MAEHPESVVDRERDDRKPDDVARDGRSETATERADRNFGELLQELRVAQTGVQLLFAFLLTVPFTDRFVRLGAEQHGIYLGTLIATALAAICLIAPVSHHRVLFGRRRKTELVRDAARLASIGLIFLCLSMVAAVFLIFDVVVGRSVGIGVAAVLAVIFVLLWWVQPILRR